jgi:hypothetical protein
MPDYVKFIALVRSPINYQNAEILSAWRIDLEEWRFVPMDPAGLSCRPSSP